MGRRKHPAVLKLSAVLDEIFDALGEASDYKIKNIQRKATSRPYRELRVFSLTLHKACRDPVVQHCIEKHIKQRIPGSIGAYPKQYIPDNQVLTHNNVTLDGIMIHVPLDYGC